MLTLDLQLYAVLVMLLAGIALGLLFDIYRGVRVVVNPGPLLTGIGDVLFWAAATVILIAALLCGTWGEIRLFVPVAIALGLGAYRVLAGLVVVRAAARALRCANRAARAAVIRLRRLVAAAERVVTFLLGIVLWPLQALAGLFDRPRRWLMRSVRRLCSPAAALGRCLAGALRAFREGPPRPPNV